LEFKLNVENKVISLTVLNDPKSLNPTSPAYLNSPKSPNTSKDPKSPTIQTPIQNKKFSLFEPEVNSILDPNKQNEDDLINQIRFGLSGDKDAAHSARNRSTTPRNNGKGQVQKPPKHPTSATRPDANNLM